MVVRIRENSWFASLAARKLKTAKVAMVLGNTIHLWNTSREEFLANQRWLCHELAHVEQYARYGFFRFVVLYLFESLRHGYRNNRFEAEAREREKHSAILLNHIIE